MSQVPSAMDFLDSLAAFTEAAPGPDRANRIAVVDPAYDSLTFPGTLPRVTFEGESALSVKRYVCLSPYHPKKSDRVLMVPCGHTYVIAGSLAWVPWSFPQAVDGGDIPDITTTAPTAGSVVVGTTFTAPPSGRVWINLSGGLFAENANTEIILGWELRAGAAIGAGTVIQPAISDLGITAGRAASAQVTTTRREPVSGLVPGDTYNVRTMHWVGVGEGRITYRKIVVEAV